MSAFCGAFGLFISILHSYKFPVDRKILASVVQYRFRFVVSISDEHRLRSLWGRAQGLGTRSSIIHVILARWIWIAVDANEEGELMEEKVMRLVAAFAVATKLHLRNGHTIDRCRN